MIPDINCLVNDFPEFFGFPEKEINPNIEPQPINSKIDPFIVFLNSILEEKEEEVDKFINIDDINVFYQIDGNEETDIRIILDECSQIPKKYSLNILELNYLYCAIVWKNGFESLTQRMIENEDFKNGFLKIVNNTIIETFDYKTYIRDIKINKYTAKFWMKFYENLLEYNDINTNYENYD